MRIKIFFKKFIAISVAVLGAVTLAGCFDLGGFSNDAEYYDAFGDIGLVYNASVLEKDVEKKDYSIKDYFYNKATGEDFAYGDPKDDESDEGKDIPQLPYVYMAIPVKEKLSVESVALYFNATQTCSLEVFFYVVDTLPEFANIMLWGDPEYQPEIDDATGEIIYKQQVDENGNPITDSEGNPIYVQKTDENGNLMVDEQGNPIYEPILEKVDYSDPDDSLIVAKANVYVKNEEWVSLIVENWNGKSALEIEENQYVLLRFVNNSGVYTGINHSVEFRVTNLLIRAFPISDS